MSSKRRARPALIASIATAGVVAMSTAVPALGGPSALSSATPLSVAKRALKVARAADKRSKQALAKAGKAGPAGPAGANGANGTNGTNGAAGAPGPTASASATFTTAFGSETALPSADTTVVSLSANGQRITTTFNGRLIATAAIAMRERQGSATPVLAACRLQIASGTGAFEDMSTTQSVSFSGSVSNFEQVVVNGAVVRPAGTYDVRVTCTGSAGGDVGARSGDLTVIAAAA
jgi:hypothetical protein